MVKYYKMPNKSIKNVRTLQGHIFTVFLTIFYRHVLYAKFDFACMFAFAVDYSFWYPHTLVKLLHNHIITLARKLESVY
jgi:hypothetical protein